MTNGWESVRHALKIHWGYEDFRPPQDQVVRCLLSGQDAMVVLPTGYGKSLCFQVPALFGDGVTLVISPLIALMEDQVGDLRRRGLAAAALHSELLVEERRAVLQALERNRLRLLYLSPETLFSPAVWERLQRVQVRINGLMIDEAHTLVHWGDSFRPDFRRLGCVRPALNKSFPLAAFTATADPYTEAVLHQVLQLHRPQIVRIDPRRANLHLAIQVSWSQAGRRRRMLRFIRHSRGSSGLVYVRTRHDARDLSQWLHRQGVEAAAYHGGLGSQQRRQLERRWLVGERPVLVCTNAFGMGIDKPDVRWVLHYHPPLSVTDYIQEVGRGGRDGQQATGLMLVSEPTGWLDPTDRGRQAFFLSQRSQVRRQAADLIPTLPAEGSYPDLLRSQGAKIGVVLALLHQAGCLVWTDPFHFVLTDRPRRLPDLHPPSLGRLYRDPTYGMEQVIHTRGCRWHVLMRVFGYPAGEPCQVCDNCRRLAR